MWHCWKEEEDDDEKKSGRGGGVETYEIRCYLIVKENNVIV